MQRLNASSIVLLGTICFATSAGALQKKALPAPDRPDDWSAGTTCTTSYYNICTGWVWVWSGFGDGGRLGVVFSQGPGAQLYQSSIFVATSSPAGYGFTGTVAVHNVDANDCPTGPAIGSQPFLPTSVFHVSSWGGLPVPSEFALVVKCVESQGIPNPASYGTDHPAAGPTGPQACGACYPATRENHSFAYGTAASPVCPGSVFNDGVCDAQLFWDVTLFCAISTEASSWGHIKGLYR